MHRLVHNFYDRRGYGFAGAIIWYYPYVVALNENLNMQCQKAKFYRTNSPLRIAGEVVNMIISQPYKMTSRP